MSLDVGKLGVDTLNAARRWARARIVFRRTLDSRAASKQQRDKAKRAYDKTNTDLENTVAKLEKAMRAAGSIMSMDKVRGGSTFPWNKLFGMVSEVAKAVETAVEAPNNQTPPQVIDATPPPDKE